eukprot:3281646-Karenia_brevis.AAC.1
MQKIGGSSRKWTQMELADEGETPKAGQGRNAGTGNGCFPIDVKRSKERVTCQDCGRIAYTEKCPDCGKRMCLPCTYE